MTCRQGNASGSGAHPVSRLLFQYGGFALCGPPLNVVRSTTTLGETVSRMSNLAADNPPDTSAGVEAACENSVNEAGGTPEISGVGIPAGLLTRTGNGASCEVETSEQIEALLTRVNELVPDRATDFFPNEPRSIAATGLTSEEVEKLVLKLLSARGSASGRRISSHLCLPLSIIEDIIRHLRDEQLVALKGAAEAGDYDYVLSDKGRTRAAEYSHDSTYFGAAPVCLADYLSAMAAQSIAGQEVTDTDLKRAFSDLIINPAMLDRLGPAINSGRGMFLFGEPGNGKTSIAERITACFSSTIWIPRALGIDGEIVRLFDPGIHKTIDAPVSDSLIDLSDVDRRWVQIERPTVVVGGELTMADLEVSQNPATRICESPVQLKSNCGTLVIDDFGRQRMPVDELLNRWIVPLEKRYDFLNLPSGKKIQVPFDQLIVFSTNLEPKDLVDGAFLRRIPYKIQVPDPSEEEFKAIMNILAPIMGFEYEEKAVQYLIDTHFHSCDRKFRSCHPRDLLLQVRNYCTYHRMPRKMTPEAFDFATENYFSVL